MKLSTKGRYGLRALIDLALYSESEAVSIQSIATRQNISDSYLEQLVRKLKSAAARIRHPTGKKHAETPKTDLVAFPLQSTWFHRRRVGFK